jgi:cyclopropane-fatty-acyl-phospholipid synthase
MNRVATRLPIQLVTPGGLRSGRGGRAAPAILIRDENAFYRRLGSGTAGLAEAYIAGAWDSDDLPGLFAVLAEHITELIPAPLQALRRWYIPLQPPAEDATIDGARRNIERHYDLSDELFALFLDPTMTYSSALFAPGDRPACDGPAGDLVAGDGLTRAQHRKIDALLDRTGVGPQTSVLEIGSGWGELAIRAARRGARVTTLTISPSQWQTARRRAAAAGVADRVDVQLRDYREATGRYDAVLSVEMIEAVGERYWPAYFCAIDRRLAPGGRAGLQAITLPHDRMLASRGGHTWIHQYIFPGGQIPSLEAISASLRRHTGLRVTADYPMGQHYARTLQEWRTRFAGAAAEVSELGFGESFQRMWNLYLAYCEGGFSVGYLDVHQLVLERRQPAVR